MAFRYSIWLDSKLRLHTDPMMLIEYFLWRRRSEYAISNHYTRHCVWDEVQQNKRLNKYNHTAIDEQFLFYQADGLVKFDPSDPKKPLPSCAYRWYFIFSSHFGDHLPVVRAKTLMFVVFCTCHCRCT